ncbi:hypothetical protein GWI33_007457 [Rhynchophorus ferrugineus]|uniref:Uncharacterized protein n=1 Tax=Rhynchophorus ferrugineus TaxID=354439 RepID=A0A834IED3_RHYFE|nr:hypothetical protein GWI33_007457 [Rhynchophorus ferrugineus]
MENRKSHIKTNVFSESGEPETKREWRKKKKNNDANIPNFEISGNCYPLPGEIGNDTDHLKRGSVYTAYSSPRFNRIRLQKWFDCDKITTCHKPQIFHRIDAGWGPGGSPRDPPRWRFCIFRRFLSE